MIDLLWLLLPMAAASGWLTAKWSVGWRQDRNALNIPNEYMQGLNYLVNEQPDKALEVFIRFVEVDSDTIETHIILGNLFRQRGEVERAIRIHQNLIARPSLDKSHRTNALLELGRDYLKAGLLDRAEDLFLEVISIGMQKKEAYQHLKELYEQEKDWEKAISNAISLQGETGKSQHDVIAQYFCELGELARKKNNVKEAEKIAKKALSCDQNSVRASILLGNLAFAKDDYKNAIKHYSNVSAQNSVFISAVLPCIKITYESDNNLQGYQRFLQNILVKYHALSSTLGLIDAYLDQEDFVRAEALLKKELNKPEVPLIVLRKYIQCLNDSKTPYDAEALPCIAKALDCHLAAIVSHKCIRCGFETKALYWQCPSCHGWGTIQPRDEKSLNKSF
jgi:lipopolysaccharide biosynthesis regulator YciM